MREFEELSRYAPHLVETEAKKVRRFERGLRSEIRKIVSSHELPTYREVVRKAQAVAYASVKYGGQGSENEQGKRKWRNHNQDQNANGSNASNKKPNNKPNGGQTSGFTPLCPKCQKPHRGECLWGKGVCYKCGKPGHMAKDCRSGSAGNNDQVRKINQAKKGNARLFSMTHEDPNQDYDVSTGMLSASL